VECNSRFTAPQELLVRCGLDIASLIYDHLIGLPVPSPVSYKQGIRQWYPIRDFLAYRQLRTMNELSFGDWLKSVWHWQTFPFFQPADPLPSIMPAMLAIRRRLYSIP
jgi:predicted ATP-grasp superfamily ATP-dependent carboligase